jgi:hypothetical protein
LPPSDPLDDPVRNLWVGCLWPVLRNLLQVGFFFVLAVMAFVVTDDFLVFLGILALGVVVLTMLDRKVFRERNLREKAASNRLFGVPDDD